MSTILVADDNSNIQKMVTLAFEERGIRVVAVGNGEAAVRRIPDLNPDAILADVFMPLRNGYEVCEFVKKDARFAQTPVILLVGAFDPLDEQEARRVGADGVLKKPFVPPDPLIAMVTSILDKNAKSSAEPEAEPAAAAATPQRTVAAPPAPIPETASSPEMEPGAEADGSFDEYGTGTPLRFRDEEEEAAFAKLSKIAAEEKDEEETPTEWERRRATVDFEVPPNTSETPEELEKVEAQNSFAKQTLPSSSAPTLQVPEAVAAETVLAEASGAEAGAQEPQAVAEAEPEASGSDWKSLASITHRETHRETHHGAESLLGSQKNEAIRSAAGPDGGFEAGAGSEPEVSTMARLSASGPDAHQANGEVLRGAGDEIETEKEECRAAQPEQRSQPEQRKPSSWWASLTARISPRQDPENSREVVLPCPSSHVPEADQSFHQSLDGAPLGLPPSLGRDSRQVTGSRIPAQPWTDVPAPSSAEVNAPPLGPQGSNGREPLAASPLPGVAMGSASEPESARNAADGKENPPSAGEEGGDNTWVSLAASYGLHLDASGTPAGSDCAPDKQPSDAQPSEPEPQRFSDGPEVDPQVLDSVVAKLLEKIEPELKQLLSQELLRPVAKSLLERELQKK